MVSYSVRVKDMIETLANHKALSMKFLQLSDILVL